MSRRAVIIYGIATLFWVVRSIIDIFWNPYITPTVIGIDVVCIIVWVVGFLINLRTYLKNKDK